MINSSFVKFVSKLEKFDIKRQFPQLKNLLLKLVDGVLKFVEIHRERVGFVEDVSARGKAMVALNGLEVN
jgi:hypothetical protein